MPAALEEHCHKEERTSRAEGGLDQICYHPPASWDDWLDTESWREQLLGDGVDYSSASTQREAQSEVNLAFLSLMPIYLSPWPACHGTHWLFNHFVWICFSCWSPYLSVECHCSIPKQHQMSLLFAFSLYILSSGHILFLLKYLSAPLLGIHQFLLLPICPVFSGICHVS